MVDEGGGESGVGWVEVCGSFGVVGNNSLIA